GPWGRFRRAGRGAPLARRSGLAFAVGAVGTIIVTMFTEQDHAWMLYALELASRGMYGTTPNPRVGCVIVRDNEVVGEGWHRRAGEPHAEVLALAQAGGRARGATVYVTLEPCAHHGKTPPCANALVEAQVGR